MLTIAVSSRALFDLTEENKIFEEEGQAAFDQYQRDHEAAPLKPGPAFHLVRKLLALNTGTGFARDKVEVVLISRNSADAGIRVMNSVEHHKLDIERAVFTKGTERFKYAKAFGAQLFLSANPEDVRQALEGNLAAATLLPYTSQAESRHEEIRIAFDGDAVLFSDEAERVTQTQGLAAFIASERHLANQPLSAGPFKQFLESLAELQRTLDASSLSKIKIALVTARGAYSYERVLRTLRGWGIQLDEIVFAGGLAKGPFLEVFGADMFFDDTRKNCDSAQEYVATGHVPHGVMNEKKRGMRSGSL